MGGVEKLIQRGIDSTIKPAAKWAEDRLHGSNINAAPEPYRKKFGTGEDTPREHSPGRFDPPPSTPPPPPSSGFQIDLGRPGDPSNPMPAPLPWDSTPQGPAPESLDYTWLPSYNQQVKRLKYRKFAKERGL